MNVKPFNSRPKAFTLVEMLIVIVIIATLAALAFTGLRRGLESARMAANIQNLRALGTAVKTLEDDNGAMPLGYNWGSGVSWATLVVQQQTQGLAKQDKIVLAPTVNSDIPPNFKYETISNYAVNPIIFPDNTSEGGSVTMKYRVTALKLSRPSEQILLGDALPRSTNAPYGHSMIVWWGLRGGASGNTWSNPPVADPAAAETTVALPKNIEKLKVDQNGGLPAFRNRGKGHFLFADGHVEALAPAQLKMKHFAISY